MIWKTVIPIIITVPFGDGDQVEKSEERKAYEVNLIHRFTSEGEGMSGNEDFYDEYNFYPYKNPNPRGQPLSAKQLYDLLNDELDLFLPEMQSAAEVEKNFRCETCIRTRNYRTKFVPPTVDPRSGKMAIEEGEEIQWCDRPYVIIADDPDCFWGKFFYINEYEYKKRLIRKFHKERQDDDATMSKKAMELYLDQSEENQSENEEDFDETDPYDYQHLENTLASKWLGIEYFYCFLYGIESSFMQLNCIPIDLASLESGNLFFCELMPDEYSYGISDVAEKEVQQSLEKMEEDPSKYITRLNIISTGGKVKFERR